MREFLLLTLLPLLALSPLHAQEAEVNPATKPGSVQIVFLPPPMEGTLSLGIYNKAGKLVRTLKREAIADKDFTVGLNGLITPWDGKDDQGMPVKAGVYSMRGFAVRGVAVSGEAYHGNDWIENEDSPRVREITSISALSGERLGLTVKLADGKESRFESGLKGPLQPASGEAPAAPLKSKAEVLEQFQLGSTVIRDGQFQLGSTAIGNSHVPPAKAVAHEFVLPELHHPLDFSPGKDRTLWVIDKSEERVEVQQYSAAGEFLRRLSITAGEPVPEQIAASETSDLIFLLERGPGVQRVRGLALETLHAPLPAADAEPEPGAPKSSTWRIVFSKSIHACDDFASAADQLGRPERPKPEAKISVKLAKNPLGPKGEGATLEMTVATEPDGSFLQTSDGLTLCRLTDTPGLKWAVLLKDAKGYELVQSDGAVIEEYRLGKLTSMMAFDAGEYELKW